MSQPLTYKHMRPPRARSSVRPRAPQVRHIKIVSAETRTILKPMKMHSHRKLSAASRVLELIVECLSAVSNAPVLQSEIIVHR